jgi:hypothetical protein
MHTAFKEFKFYNVMLLSITRGSQSLHQSAYIAKQRFAYLRSTAMPIARFFISLVSTIVTSNAIAEGILVCGDPSLTGVGAEITVAQFITGEDSLAPVIKSNHWRIQHKKISAPVCPAFEIEPFQKIYMRVQKPTGELHTADQYSMYHLNQDPRPNYTGNYNLFLEMAPREDNFYRWYKSPFFEIGGQAIASPTIGANGTSEWAGMYPLKSGFAETELPSNDTIIIVK